LTIGAALLFLGSGAMAQDLTAVKACAIDIKTKCAGVQPGNGRIRDCIKAHIGDLTEPCHAVLLKAAAIGTACKADIIKDCAGVKPGGGRIEACVKTHLNDVSEPCKDALAQAAAGRT
jgi:hypothetical protein